MQTLEDGRNFLKDNWKQGVACPCCKQFVKLYRRKFNASMAYGLSQVYLLSKDNGGDWFHTNELLERKLSFSELECPKLAYWNLLEHRVGSDDPAKKNSGYWRLTQKGRDFVEGKLSIQSHVLVFNAKVYGFSDTTIWFKTALGNRFSYPELMGYGTA